MKIIGTARIHVASTEITIAEDENGEVYFFENQEKFEAATKQQQSAQHIFRFVSNTAFYDSGRKTLEITFWKEHAETKEYLKNKFGIQDEKLTALASLCEGSDTNDFEKFFDVISIEEYSEIKEMGSNLSSGLGFPGKGFGFISCTENHFHFGMRKRIFLQTVHSYMEGYSVEHQEVTPELFVLIQTGKITNESWKL